MPALSSIWDAFASVATWQLWTALALLLVLLIALICALASRRRRIALLLAEKERAGYEAEQLEREHAAELQEKADALQAQQDAMEEAQVRQTRTVNEVTSRAEELQKFHDEYAAIPDAQKEAARIIREAKDHAYIVSNRTELEYAEIIEHANHEAEAIRNTAQQRLNHSHEVLKKALSRASEIVEEAHAEAARIVLEAPARMDMLEAPAEDADLPGEPERVEADASERPDADR